MTGRNTRGDSLRRGLACLVSLTMMLSSLPGFGEGALAPSQDVQAVEASVDPAVERLPNSGNADAATAVIPETASGQDGAQADAGADGENPPVGA